MSTNVNTFFQFTNYISNKSQSGNTITPADFDIIANNAQMYQFTQDYETYNNTGVCSNYLKTFLKIGGVYQVPPTTHVVPYPSDFEYVSSMRHYYNQTQYKVEYVDNIEVGEILVPNSLEYPTKRFAKYQYVDDGLNIMPNDVGIIYLDYFRTPVAPHWGYTIANDEPVYDPANSTNFEWGTYFFNRIASIYLQFIGINLQDGQIEKFANEFTAETKVLL